MITTYYLCRYLTLIVEDHQRYPREKWRNTLPTNFSQPVLDFLYRSSNYRPTPKALAISPDYPHNLPADPPLIASKKLLERTLYDHDHTGRVWRRHGSQDDPRRLDALQLLKLVNRAHQAGYISGDQCHSLHLEVTAMAAVLNAFIKLRRKVKKMKGRFPPPPPDSSPDPFPELPQFVEIFLEALVDEIEINPEAIPKEDRASFLAGLEERGEEDIDPRLKARFLATFSPQRVKNPGVLQRIAKKLKH